MCNPIADLVSFNLKDKNLMLKDYITNLIKFLSYDYCLLYYSPESRVRFFFYAWEEILLQLKDDEEDNLAQVFEFGRFCVQSMELNDDFIDTNKNLYLFYLSIIRLFFEIIQISYIENKSILKILKIKICDLHKDNLFLTIPFNFPIEEINPIILDKNLYEDENYKYLVFSFLTFIKMELKKE